MTYNQRLTLAGFDIFKRNGKTWIAINEEEALRPPRPDDLEEFVKTRFGITI